MGYWAYGRFFPRDKQTEATVSTAEYQQMLADENVVCVALPEVSEKPSKSKAQ